MDACNRVRALPAALFNKISNLTLTTPDHQIIERVHALPAELFNKIRGLTFNTADYQRIHIEIDKSYKPPALLQVDRASRRSHAPPYYGSTFFDFQECSDGINLCAKWLSSLLNYHKKILRYVRIVERIVVEESLDDAASQEGFSSCDRWTRERAEEQVTTNIAGVCSKSPTIHYSVAKAARQESKPFEIALRSCHAVYFEVHLIFDDVVERMREIQLNLIARSILINFDADRIERCAQVISTEGSSSEHGGHQKGLSTCLRWIIAENAIYMVHEGTEDEGA